MDRREVFHKMEEDSPMDPYFVSYNIYSIGLQRDTFEEGFEKSLYFARMYMLSDDIYLYRLDENGQYYSLSHSPYLQFKPQDVQNLVTSSKARLAKLEDPLELNFDDNIVHKLSFVPVKTQDTSYLLVIINNNIDDKIKNDFFLSLLQSSYKGLLQNAENYWKLERISREDALTGLRNRLAYNELCGTFPPNKVCTYALIDLFRLKHINDTYGHEAGDQYIIGTANALGKLFPEQQTVMDQENGLVRVPTGNTIYRIGGDEFVVLSEKLSEEEVSKRLDCIHMFLDKIPFVVEHKETVGANYGVAAREPGDDIDALYRKADIRLAHQKTETYKKLKLDRRK